MQTSTANVGLISALVVGGVAAAVIALALFVGYRRRKRSQHRANKGLAARMRARSVPASGILQTHQV